MKYINLGFLSLLLLFTTASCSEDKGNYDYEEVPEITITGIQETYDLLRGVDNLTFSPTITSSTEGEISPDDPNYEYGCELMPNNGTSFGDTDNSATHDMNPDKTQSFTYNFNEPVGSYKGIYTIKDRRTDVITYHTFNISLRSSVYEGWMVLCNEGDDNRVRLDMVSVISQDNITPVYNVLNATFPEQHNATQIMYDRSMYSSGDYIYLMSETGSFQLNNTELTAEAADNVAGQFLTDLGEDVPIRFAACGCCIPGAYGHFMTTKEGNVYINNLSGSGSAYEFVSNTSEELADAEYHVSPYIGVGMERNGQMFNPSSTSALFYDVDNQRFMGWDAYAENKLLYQIPENEATFIPFGNTGQDLVYMEGTSYNQNTVFAILQDATGARSVLAINMTDDQYRQENYYEDIQAENFNVAEHFTFHSLYPYMFYGYNDKLYSYNLGTGALKSLTLPGEEITMVKIDLFKWLSPSAIPEDMVPQQHYVLVGSYNSSSSDNNGGILRRYRLNNSTGELELVNEWDGFARIVDVTYRERF